MTSTVSAVICLLCLMFVYVLSFQTQCSIDKCGASELKCCTGCCRSGKCVSDIRCIKKPSCINHTCPPNEKCYLQRVECIKYPCDLIPTCTHDSVRERRNADTRRGKPVKCCDKVCPAGSHCLMLKTYPPQCRCTK